MINVNINSKFKSLPSGLTYSLSDFSILTGKNGSGKSHLLEAISKNPNTVHFDDGTIIPIEQIKYVPFGALAPQIEPIADRLQIRQAVLELWNVISSTQQTYAAHGEDIFVNNLFQLSPLVNNSYLHQSIKHILNKTNKNFKHLIESDVSENLLIPPQQGQTDVLASRLALIYVDYQNKINQNILYKHYKDLRYLDEQSFEGSFGKKPWDIVNQILKTANLIYATNTPEGLNQDTTFNLEMIDCQTNELVPVNDLSTGEKVLLSIAIAIYNVGGGKPVKLLLLDEPDAPMHPEYSKILIEIIHEVLVKNSGVKVIISTHSPSTVAVCPENCLFEIDRESKELRSLSIQEGLGILTAGIPHLRVSTEQRRHIFVEHENDVKYMTGLFNTVFRSHKDELKFEPIFLSPHTGTSNCNDVKNIVNKLSAAGDVLVRGLIDYDNGNIPEDFVYVLGEGNRYSIENYILDPIFIALWLIKTRKPCLNLTELTHNRLNRYTSAPDLTNLELQEIVEKIFELLEIEQTDLAPCTLENGFNIQYPKKFLEMRGHDYEALLKEKIPVLNELTRGGTGDAELKLKILIEMDEFPQFLSVDIINTFKKLE